MQESCTYGSVRGAPSNGRPYRNRYLFSHCFDDQSIRTRDAKERTRVLRPKFVSDRGTMANEPSFRDHQAVTARVSPARACCFRRNRAAPRGAREDSANRLPFLGERPVAHRDKDQVDEPRREQLRVADLMAASAAVQHTKFRGDHRSADPRKTAKDIGVLASMSGPSAMTAISREWG